ncbi:hypothetical protein [Oribacterium sp. WCC10]|uniref:hypothetical protein n=1 Tax=Oribacterium sp. WCC10 TaxID=1855343 RepID=UPI0008F0E22F|nr:hypothetical protein [Oribacterium sp. WCC10]SFG30089.1 hypothetical protein SAMN05216356_10550 [Oribacterium sp. WCC10]
MKIAEQNIIAAFLWQMNNEHRSPFVNVNTLAEFSKYLDRIAKRKSYDYELRTTNKALLEAGEGSARYFHIMRVKNGDVGLETFIQLNHDASADELYESYIRPCDYDLRRILTNGAEEYIKEVAKVEKSTATIEMGM